MTTIELILILAICSAGVYLGWLFTESKQHALNRLSEKLNRKPFNCRPCLTFHITWLLFGIVSFLIYSPRFFLIGIICSFILFILLYIEHKSIIDK